MIESLENTKAISVDVANRVTLDKNTAMVVPGTVIAGYVPPESGKLLTRVTGASTSTPSIQVVDPTKVMKTTYYLTFSDSMQSGVPVGYAYTLVDSSSGDTVFANNKHLLSTNGDIFDGMMLSISKSYQILDSLRLDYGKSGWNSPDSNNLKYTITQFHYKNIDGIRYPYDYLFVFHDKYQDTSSSLSKIFGSSSPLTPVVTNFSIYDVTDRSNPKKIQYGFVDQYGPQQDTLSDFDVVFLSNPDGSKLSWRITFQGDAAKIPAAGDSLLLVFQKPYSSKDKFLYRSKGTQYDIEAAKSSMNDIKAVPNPYVVTNMFEKPLPPQVRGRGERVIYFTNLPPNSKISIYNSAGDHIKTIYQDGNYQAGTATWDLRTKEGLDASFGVYFYVVEAPGISIKKFGKLAIIK